MFSRLGTWCHDRRKLVVGLWLAVLILGNVIGGRLATPSATSSTCPTPSHGRASTSSTTTSAARAPASPAPSSSRPPRASTTPRSSRRWRTCSQRGGDPRRRPGREPLRGGRRASDLLRGRPPGEIAYANVELPDDIDFPGPKRSATRSSTRSHDIEGLRVELGGFIFAEFEQPSSEALGVGFAIVILILAFGSVLAMGLPGRRGAVRHRHRQRHHHRCSATCSRSPTSPRSSAS